PRVLRRLRQALRPAGGLGAQARRGSPHPDRPRHRRLVPGPPRPGAAPDHRQHPPDRPRTGRPAPHRRGPAHRGPLHRAPHGPALRRLRRRDRRRRPGDPAAPARRARPRGPLGPRPPRKEVRMTVTDLDARRTGKEEPPPHDIDAEQIVVGAAILDRRALSDIAEIITPADLFRPAHQTILQTVMDMADDGKPLGAVAVAAELERRGASRATGGGVYLHTLTDAVPSVANAGYYARIVADLAGRRRIAEDGARIHQLGMSAEGEAGEVAERAVEALAEAVVDGSQDDGDTEAIGDDAEFIDRLAAPVDTSRAVPAPYAE